MLNNKINYEPIFYKSSGDGIMRFTSAGKFPFTINGYIHQNFSSEFRFFLLGSPCSRPGEDLLHFLLWAFSPSTCPLDWLIPLWGVRLHSFALSANLCFRSDEILIIQVQKMRFVAKKGNIGALAHTPVVAQLSPVMNSTIFSIDTSCSSVYPHSSRTLNVWSYWSFAFKPKTFWLSLMN